MNTFYEELTKNSDQYLHKPLLMFSIQKKYSTENFNTQNSYSELKGSILIPHEITEHTHTMPGSEDKKVFQVYSKGKLNITHSQEQLKFLMNYYPSTGQESYFETVSDDMYLTTFNGHFQKLDGYVANMDCILTFFRKKRTSALFSEVKHPMIRDIKNLKISESKLLSLEAGVTSLEEYLKD